MLKEQEDMNLPMVRQRISNLLADGDVCTATGIACGIKKGDLSPSFVDRILWACVRFGNYACIQDLQAVHGAVLSEEQRTALLTNYNTVQDRIAGKAGSNIS